MKFIDNDANGRLLSFKILILFIIGITTGQTVDAQSSDSMMVRQLREKGIRFSHNNSVTLLKNGREKFKDLFTAIEQAKSSIHLEYFNFRNDSINKELMDRLFKKASEGVEVRAIFDGFGNASNNQPIRKKDLRLIRSKGVEIYEFNPVRFPFLNDFFNRDHRKIAIIDGIIAYTGGMNVADYYIKGTKQVGTWNDMHCRIEGNEVNTLQAIFLRMWHKVSKQSISGTKYFNGGQPIEHIKGLKRDTTATRNHKMVGIINREPHVTKDIIRTFYANAINDAKDSIKIINPYFTLNRKLKKALKNAVKRGVKVEIMLSIHSDVPLTPDAALFNAHNLMQAGCTVWMYEPGFHHTKIITVDGKFCTVGSANLDARSLRWDREENAVIIDKHTTRELDSLFRRDTQQSYRLTEKNWDQTRSRWEKLRGWFAARILHPFL